MKNNGKRIRKIIEQKNIPFANVQRAITFYEDLLQIHVAHREKDTWADFDMGNGYYFGLINPNIISNRRIIGNNTIPVFWTDNVDAIYEKVKKWKCKTVDSPTNLEFTDYPYRCFQFYDTEGNLIEIANYKQTPPPKNNSRL